MIYLIIGANVYVVDVSLKKIQQTSGCAIERYDTATLTVSGLADLVRGGTLFQKKRLIVLDRLSENKNAWDKLGNWANDVTQDTTLVLIEDRLDKRTKTYKTLAKAAKVILADPWTEYDASKAEQWLASYAKQCKVKISSAQCRDMVIRSLVADASSNKRTINQMQLVRAVAALRLCDEVTDEAVATVLPPAAFDTIFDLFSEAAHRDKTQLSSTLATLRDSADAYVAFSVVMGQWSQLVAAALAPRASASDLGIHPYALKKIRELVPLFKKQEIATLTRVATTMDALAKQSAFLPWDNLERFLFEVAMR